MPVYVCVCGRPAGAALFHPGPFLVRDAAGRNWACWQSPRPDLEAPETPEEAALWQALANLQGQVTYGAFAILRARLECAGPTDLARLLSDSGG